MSQVCSRASALFLKCAFFGLKPYYEPFFGLKPYYEPFFGLKPYYKPEIGLEI